MNFSLILAGGVGSRLFPLSTPEFPKQFIRLFEGLSTFQLTLRRAMRFSEHIVVSANIAHKDLVSQELALLGNNDVTLIFENEGVGTLKPIIDFYERYKQDCKRLVVLQSDHFFSDETAYVEQIKYELQSNLDPYPVVLHGVKSKVLDSNFGYILLRENLNGGDFKPVQGFLEKPDPQTLASLSVQLKHLQHAGSMIFTESFKNRLSGLSVKSGSIDRVVFEQLDCMGVSELAGGWIDVGTFDKLAACLPCDQYGNYTNCEAIPDGLVNCFVVSGRWGVRVLTPEIQLRSHSFNVIGPNGTVIWTKNL